MANQLSVFDQVGSGFYFSYLGSLIKIEDKSSSETSFVNLKSLTFPSFEGDPIIFHNGIFLKQTPHIKN